MPDRLADFILENITLDFKIILEVGCGEGQLTIPFARKLGRNLNEYRIIAYDLSIDPYSDSLEILKEKIKKGHFEDIIIIKQGDVRDMKGIGDESIDFIYSNDLFCDLDRNGLEKALYEFYRILKPNGQMAHAEYIAVSENAAQKLFIEADMHSLGTSLPKPDWFSPSSDEIAVLMHKIGFNKITIKYFETGIYLSLEEALEALEEWTVDPKYIEENKELIRKYGLETPMEHVIFCQK